MQRSVPSPPEWPGARFVLALVLGLGFAVVRGWLQRQGHAGPAGQGQSGECGNRERISRVVSDEQFFYTSFLILT